MVNSTSSSAVDDNPSGSLIRDRLANERTFLAWLRTAANVMIVGLAIARFGDGGEVTVSSLVAGGFLMAVGASGVVYSAARYRAGGRELERGGSRVGAHTRGPIIASVVLVTAVVVAVVLLVAGQDVG